MRLALYVTGHGFGHATREVALLSALFERAGDGGLFVHAIADVPEFIFGDLLRWRSAMALHRRRVDVGLLQSDALSIDFEATRDALVHHLGHFDEAIPLEARFLERERIDAVIADIPALPFAAAEAVGIPSFAVSNFSWDFIYRAYAERSPVFARAADVLAGHYASATTLFRLPFAAPMPAFPRAVDVPFLVRTSRTSAERVRSQLGFANDPRPLALVCFGGLALLDLDEASLHRQKDVLVAVFGIPPERSAGHVRCVAKDELYFPDLVNAADVLVSKPGYGLVAEAIAHDTAFLYVPRDDFAESEHLVRALQAHVVSAPISTSELKSGAFVEKMCALARMEPRASSPAIDGARVIAEAIEMGIEP
jgi:L-arabinokinase